VLEVPPVMKKITKTTRKRKFRDTRMEVTVVYDGQPTSACIMECEEAEAKMAQQDRLIKETDDARNDLETYVTSVCIIHVGGTRCVTSRTGKNMKRRARISWTVECIRGYIF
jgi:ketosteroid isomerase-like protein